MRIADLLTTTGTTAATVRSRAETEAAAAVSLLRAGPALTIGAGGRPLATAIVDALPRNPAGKIVKGNLPR